MTSAVLNILLILLLVVIGGVFVAAEFALVSLRESQVSQLANRGKRGQLVAKLTSNPNRFLSAVQVGVTLSGFLAAAFGADRLSDDLAPLLMTTGLSVKLEGPLAVLSYALTKQPTTARSAGPTSA